ncbi:MAG: hypothetical protein JXA33_17935 [Anaerolineae bacterium]|nr:hypothetical protein [Anaerolineae bacterium]
MHKTEMSIHAHSQAINDCNQRGGRMLSLVDLLDAGTVDLPLAAYLATVMRNNEASSFLVGAKPGGAGKTAVMCALLNFLPDHTAIRPVEGRAVLVEGRRDTDYGATCYLAHEIGNGYYYAYIWGEQVRDFIGLAGQGHSIASNLHADTLDETYAQLCTLNGADPAHLARVTLKLYLRVAGYGWNAHRHLSYVYEATPDDTEDRLLWTGDSTGTFTRHAPSARVAPAEERVYADFLRQLREQDVRCIEDVRRALLQA